MRSRGIYKVAAAVQTLLLLASLVLPGTISAETPPSLSAQLAAGVVTVTGADWGADTSVDLVTTDPAGATSDEATVQASATGSLTYVFNLVSPVEGTYHVSGSVAGSGASASADFEGPVAPPVTDPPAQPDPTDPPAQPDPTDPPAPDPTSAPTASYVVMFAAGTSGAAQAAAIAAAGAVDEGSVPQLRLHSVSATAAAIADLISAPSVTRVDVDRSRAVEADPSDPGYAGQWALPVIGWDDVFGTVDPAGSAVVAVLDTGVDAGHPDLAGQLVAGTSILDGSSGATDPNGHGTWMAGIIAALTDNGSGIAGVGFDGVRVMPVTVLGADGTGQDSDIIAGIVWATDNGADVINMSFSNPGYSAALQAAIDYAWANDVVVVAATGNDATSSVTFPAGDRGVIGVSATNQSDALAPSSNYGQAVFLAAPGVEISTTTPGGGTTAISGTSASSAIVAAAAALLRAADGSASNGVIAHRLAANADAAGSVAETGNGRLNLARAIADTSTDSVQPAGAAPVGGGGPLVGPYVTAADGEGSLSISPTSVVASSSGNNLTFTFTVGASGFTGNQATPNLQVAIPSGWTAPTTGAGNGHVAISSETCSGSVTIGTSGQNIQIFRNGFTTSSYCTSGQQVVVTYGPATAGSTTGAIQFTTSTRDSTSNGGLANITPQPTVTVTAAGPTVTGVSSTLANGSYTTGQLVPIQITFSQAVNVSGSPQLALNSGGTASYGSGAGTTVLTFNYTVGAGHNAADLNYTSTSALTLNGGTITATSGGANAILTLPATGGAGSLGTNKNIVIDTTVPTVSSINPVTSPSGATFVDFTVTFNESVTGVDAGNFSLVTTGTIAGASIGTISGTGNSRTVEVNTGTGEGTIRLDLSSVSPTITDAAGNAVAATFSAGGLLTVERTAPTVVSIDPDMPASNDPSVPFTVIFSEPVTGVASGNFSLVASGGLSGVTLGAVTGSGDTWTVNVNTGTGAGTIRLDLSSTTPAINDGGGNALTATFNTGSLLSVDKSAPVVNSFKLDPASDTGTSPTDGITNATDPVLNLVFNEPVSDPPSGSITKVSGSATGCVISIGAAVGNTFPVTVSGCSEGNFVLQMAAGAVQDAAGNLSVLTSSQNVVIDRTAPTVSSINRNDPSPTGSSIVNWNVGFSGAVSFVDDLDFVLAETGVTGAAISNVAGFGAAWVVTASTGTGEGTLGLNLVDNDTITDIAGNLLDGPGTGGIFTGQVYTIDKTAPVVTIVSPLGDTVQEPGGVSVSWTESDGAGSGLNPATRSVQRQSAEPVGFACIAVTWADDGAPTSAASPRNDSSLASETCYRWVVSIDDLAGNIGTATSGTVLVDNTGPVVTFTSPMGNTSQTGTSVNVDWTEVDLGSGVDTATRSVQRESATPIASSCTAVVWSADGAPTTDPSPRNDTGLASDTCYRWVVTIDDNAGHTSITTSGTVHVDHTQPTVANVTSSNANGTYGVGASITVQVEFSEPVFVTGTPQLTLSTDVPATTDISYIGGSGTTTLSFSYTVVTDNASLDLDYASNAALALNGGSIADAAGNSGLLGLAAPGDPGSLGANKDIVIETSQPTVTGVSSSTADGIYGVGSHVLVQVTFTEPVFVTGTPRITLETGGTDAVVNSTSGSGTSTLTFDYTVGAGHTSADLDYISASALVLNGGTINDGASNAAQLTLPAPGATGSLGTNKDIVIDTVAPAVSSVTSSTPDGSYGTGDVISVEVIFNKPVFVAGGTPTLTLETGSPDAVVAYTSGSGTNTLTFLYTVAASNASNDLNVQGSGSLLLVGATIKDAGGNNAALTLPTSGGTSLSGGNAIVIVANTRRWTGAVSTDWATGGNWSGGSAPSSGQSALIPAQANQPTLGTTASIQGITLNAGATLTVAAAGSLTLAANSTYAGTLAVSGTVSNAATMATSGAGALNFGAGSLYRHTQNGGDVPSATWNPTSTVEIAGVTSSAPDGLDQDFGNFTWNATGQGSNSISLAGGMSGATVAGAFTVASTGTTGSFRLLNSGTNATLTVGSYVQTGGIFAVLGTGGSGTSSVLTVLGDFTLSSGTFRVSEASSSSPAATLNVGGDFTQSGGTITRLDNNGTASVNFNGTSMQTFSKTAGTISDVLNFAILSSAWVNFGTSVLTGSGTFTLSSGATMGIGHTAGISTSAATGQIQVTGTKSYNSAASYIYNGTSTQSTGNGLTTASNLTIDNTGGNVTLTNSATVNGALTLTSGDLSTGTGSNALTLGASSTCNGTTDVISILGATGGVSRTTIGTTTRCFGNPGNLITINSGTAPSAMLVRLVKSAPAGKPDAITRTYTISPTGGSGFGATVRLHYVDGELNGNNPDNLKLWKLSGTWAEQDVTGTNTTRNTTASDSIATNNWVQLSGITGFSDWTLANGSDNTGPTSSSVVILPDPANVAPSVTANVNDSATGNSNVTNAEYFIDSLGANGSGTAMTGTFTSSNVNVSATLSGAEFSALSEGTHTIFVHGRDSAGNWGATASATFVKDTLNPTVTIDTNPADPTNNNDPAFAFTSAGTGSAIALTECKLDLGAFVACDSGAAHAYLDVADGSHTFTVRVTDAAGNADTDSFTWTIDTLDPTVTIDANPANPTNDDNAAFAFSSDGTGTAVALTECELDLGGFLPCDSPTAQLYTFLGDGSHTFTVRVTDAAGNVGTDSYTWTIDTVDPTSSITFPVDTGIYNVASFGAGCTPSGFCGTAAGTGSDVTFVKLTLQQVGGNFFDPGSGLFDSASPVLFDALVVGPGGAVWGYAFTASQFPAQGDYTLTSRATDAAGNVESTATATFTIDPTAPVASIDLQAGSDSGIDNDNVTKAASLLFDVSFSEAVTGLDLSDFVIGAGSTATSCTFDDLTGGVLTVTGCTDGLVVVELPAGSVSDAAGNTNALASISVARDATAPIVTINQASGQIDPTNVGPIHFTVVFNQAVTGFDAFDIVLGGTATGTLSAIVTEIAPMDGTTYDVAVSGMIGNGTVTADVAALAAVDLADNASTASTSADNEVTFDRSTTTSVVSSLNPSVYGDSVTFTATVSGAGAEPEGNVEFYIDSVLYDTVALTDGEAQASISTLDVGSHTVSATYLGEADHTASNGALAGGQVVTTRPITVTVDPGQGKVYGALDPALTYSVTDGSLAFADTFTGGLVRASGEDVGTYAISIGSLAISDGNLGANYALTFEGDDFTITTRPITVTVDPGQGKVYGALDPALTYSVTDGSLAFADTFTGGLVRASGEDVGTYAISIGSLAISDGNLGANYALTFEGDDFTISLATVTVTPDGGQTKVYGTVNPVLTWTATGLTNGDTLSVFSGFLGRVAGEDVGSYAITLGSLSAGSNYTTVLAAAPVDFTITTRPITVTVDPGQGKVYGALDPALTYSVTDGSLAFADTFTGGLVRASGEDVGTYAISIGSLAISDGNLGANYALTFEGDDFTISLATVTVTPDGGQTKVYGTVNPVLTWTATGLTNGDTLSVFSGFLGRVAGEDVGSYAITLGSLSAGSNYTTVLAAAPVDFTITTRPITVTVDPGQGKVYGALDPALTYSVTDGSLAFADTFTGGLVRASGEDVGTYAISIGSLAISDGNLGANYALTFEGDDFTITTRPITVTVDPGQGKVYGALDPALTYSVTDGSLAFADTFTGGLVRASGEDVGTYAISIGSLAISDGNLGANYALTFEGDDFTISLATVTVTPDGGQTKVYGTVNPVLTWTATGLTNGDTLSVFSGFLGRVAGEDVGSYAITLGSLSAGSNYTTVLAAAPVDFTITTRPITVTVDPGQGKVYGALDPALTYSVTDGSLAFADTFTGGLVRASGEDVGTYAISIGSLAISDGNLGANYALTFEGDDFTISLATVTVTPDGGQTKVYGTVNPVLTWTATGLTNGDTLSVFSGFLGRVAGEDVGSYAITLGSLSAGSNYTTVLAAAPVDFTITTRPITVTVDPGQGKVYGALDPALTYSVTDGSLAFADTFTGGLVRASGEDVGTYAISIGSLAISDGNLGANYALTFEGDDFTISLAVLSVTPDPQTKVYGETDPGLTFAITGFVNGDDEGDLTTLPTCTRAAGEDVGSYTISCSGGVDDNYAFTNGTASFTITTRPITVTVDPGQGKVYGALDPALTYSVTDGSLAFADTFTGGLVRASGEDVGTYAISIGSLAISDGNLGANYALTFEGDDFTISLATVTVTPDGGQTKVYGTVNPVLTWTATGLTNGDTLSVFSGFLGRVAGEDVGSYAITLGSLSAGSNYTTVLAAAPVDFTITTRPITVTVDPGQGKVYGALDPALTYSVTDGSLAFADTFTGGLVRASGEDVGTYAISIGSLAISDGNLGANYALTFEGDDFTITTRPITVTVDPGQGKVYGALDPALTYSVTDGSLAFADTFTGGLVRASGEDVGTYAISIGSLAISDGNLGANYALTFEGDDFTISLAVLTISVDAATKVYGEANPAFTVSYLGFVNGDDEGDLAGTLAFSTAADETSPVGTYPVSASGLSSANYQILFVSGDLEITAKGLTISVDAATKVYGEANPAFTVSYLGFVNGDDEGDLAGTLAFSTAADETSPVGTYPVSASGLSSANYQILFVSGDLEITAKGLTISVDAATKVYGEANPAFTVSYLGFVNGDDEGDLAGTLAFSTAADETSPVGTYPVSASGLSSANYQILFVSGDLEITAKGLTISVDAATKVYGEANPAFTVSYLGFVNGDDEGDLAGTLAFSTAADETSPVGTYPVSASGLSSANYQILFVSGDLEITAKGLTISVDAATKVYGEANPAFTVSYLGFVNGDDEGDLAGTLAFSTAADETSPVGTYPVSASGLSSANYQILFVSGDLEITAKGLTISVDAATKVYGEANPAFTVSYLGFVNGDDEGDLAGTLAFSTAADETSPVGTYPVSASGLSSANYQILFVSGDLEITAKGLTISVDAATKVYGEANPAFTVSYLGFVNGDDEGDLAGTLAFSTAADETSPVGTYPVSASGLSSANYQILFVSGDLEITAKGLTISVDAATKVYGEANPAFTVSYLGFVNGDDEGDLAGTLAFSTAADETSPVGTYPVSASGLSSANYQILFVSGDLEITAKGLTISVDAATKVYGEANPAFTVSYLGFVNGDDEGDLAGTLAFSTAADETSPVGTYPVSASGLSSANYQILFVSGDLEITVRTLVLTATDQGKTFGDEFTFAGTEFTTGVGQLVNGDTVASASLASAGAAAAAAVGPYVITIGAAVFGSGSATNYDISYVNGTMNVGVAVLTVTPDPQTKVYGEANPLLTFDITGYVGDDDAGDLTTLPTCVTTADETSSVGSYAITCSGGVDDNYAFTYGTANLEIAAKGLTISVDAATKVYGEANPAFTVSYLGFVNGDDEGDLAGTLAFSTAADETSPVGTYPVSASGLSSANYQILFVSGDLEITAKGLTISVDAATKVYGEANPAFTVSYLGFVNGDDEGDLAGTLAFSTAADETSPVGTYPVSASGLSSANYQILFVSGDLEITAKGLTISVDAATKVYGEANPAFTVSYLGFVNGDDEGDLAGTLAFSTAADETSPVGTYPVSASGLSSANYQILFVSGDLEITAKGLTISVDAATKVYGEANPAFTVSYLGFVNGDDEGDLAGTLAFSTAADETSPVGTYPVSASGLSSANYQILFVSGDLEITAKGLTISVDAATKVYDGTTAAAITGCDLVGVVGSDDVTCDYSGAMATFASANVGPWTVTGMGFALDGADASNYELITVNTTTADIIPANQATLTITGPATKTLGDAAFTPTTTGGSGTGATNFTSSTLAVCTASGSAMVTIVATGTCSVTATKAADANYNSATSASFDIVINPPPGQTINFAALADKTYGDPAFLVSATGGLSGNPVTFSSITGSVCTSTGTNGTTTTIVGTGTCSIVANQAGGGGYDPAPSVQRDFNVAKAVLTVTANNKIRVYNTANPALDSTITGYVYGETSAVVSGSPSCSTTAIMSSPVGNYPITCSIGSLTATNYTFAFVAGNLQVTLANQAALTITGPASKTFGTADQAITTSGGSGTGLVSFSAGASTACSIVSNQLHVVSGTGTCSITATKAGDANYNPTTSAPFVVTITLANQAALTITGPASKTFGTADQAITTSGGSGTGLVSFSAGASTACSIVSNQLHVVSGTGTCSITATKAGDANYNPTTSAPFVVTINKANQAALTITGPASKTFGNAPFAPTTSGGSGTGATTFTSSTPAVCTASGSALVTIVAMGTCTITATKAGDANYNPRTSASFNISIGGANQATLSITGPASAIYGAPDQTVVFTGGSGTGAVTFSAGSSSACSIVAGKLHVVSGTGTCSITATKAGDGTYNPTTSAPFAVTVSKASQAITFGALASKTMGNPDFTVSATASSGLTVSFVTMTPSVCSTIGVTGSTVHLVAPGTCTIRANQSGNTNYFAAAPVQQSFTVSPAAPTGPPTTTIALSTVNPSQYMQSVTFLAVVIPTTGLGYPSGTVTFRDGGTVLGTRTLILGATSLTTSSLAVGSHTITATYNPIGSWQSSIRSLTQVVKPRVTSTSLTSSRNPSNFHQSVTFTAIVTSSFGTPTGTVTFRRGSVILATVTLNALGRATFTTSSLPRGNWTISATYNPSTTTFASSNRSITQRVR